MKLSSKAARAFRLKEGAPAAGLAAWIEEGREDRGAPEPAAAYFFTSGSRIAFSWSMLSSPP